MKVNLNQFVKVKLNEQGITILKSNYEAIWGNSSEFLPPSIDDDGFTRFQLWSFMQDFGPHIHLGCKPMFDLNIEIEER